MQRRGPREIHIQYQLEESLLRGGGRLRHIMGGAGKMLCAATELSSPFIDWMRARLSLLMAPFPRGCLSLPSPRGAFIREPPAIPRAIAYPQKRQKISPAGCAAAPYAMRTDARCFSVKGRREISALLLCVSTVQCVKPPRVCLWLCVWVVAGGHIRQDH